MNEQALYRKYRPTTFKEVLGQEQVVQALEGAIETGKIAHAYLFAGTRGTGKTSLARIFAHAIGTTDRDLHEIDAASNRGIDDVRALREEVHTLPFESSYKVYVVDEVHMLTKDAFNALLKTLEEPPAHVIFILATTEKEKVLDTIISRCQTFTFKTPTTSVLKEMLVRVAKKEKLRLKPEGAELIALLADGSFRDAHGILQKVAATSADKDLTSEEIAAVTGAPRTVLLLELLNAIAATKLDDALRSVHTLAKEGNDMRFVLTLTLRLVRAVLLMRSAPSLKNDLEKEFSEEEFSALTRHSKESKTINSKLLIHLLDAAMRTGSTYTPELPLELALIEHLDANTA
jgi:DNA polymerase-3 subunit gamma/tau